MSARGLRHPAHLNRVTWERVNRQLVAKMIGEFAHECLLRPELSMSPRMASPNRSAARTHEPRYELTSDDACTLYCFCLSRFPLDHWLVPPESIVRTRDGKSIELDAAEFVLDFRRTLGVEAVVLPVYLEELYATLFSLAYKCENQRFDSRELVDASFQEVESAMTAGHPCFVVNSGRLGFDAEEYYQYAPETASTLNLIWLAGHRDRSRFDAVPGLDYRDFIRAELGADVVDRFRDQLVERGLQPDAYVFLPMHPWQWTNRLAMTFAAELASENLVFLGAGDDVYQPQQSIRTLFNRSRPSRPYVKTALSILNMGFSRGLSSEYMEATPAINHWVAKRIHADPVLESMRFTVLQEFASFGYRHPGFGVGAPRGASQRKMLAGLWRESPYRFVDDSTPVITMAALLHCDRDGTSFLASLIENGELNAEGWVRAYLRTYFSPILHCFYAHNIAFIPHGENIILALDRGVPCRAFIKDIGEEVMLFESEPSLPEPVKRIVLEVDDGVRRLSILTDVFDSFFRFLAEVLERHTDCDAQRFWELVAECVVEYRSEHPELASRFERFDLFVPEFPRLCLNRMQLANNTQLLDLSDPAASFRYSGTLSNPIRRFQPVRTPRKQSASGATSS
ncbi:MAG: IucA/IucC family siderophore biosynthesis protein [Myxococcota bacterium]